MPKSIAPPSTESQTNARAWAACHAFKLRGNFGFSVDKITTAYGIKIDDDFVIATPLKNNKYIASGSNGSLRSIRTEKPRPTLEDIKLTLRNRFLDSIIDGKIGSGIIITRQELIQHFQSDNKLTTGCFLSNSEINTGASHSPSYNHFTMRISDGTYRIHPQALLERMQERGIL